VEAGLDRRSHLGDLDDLRRPRLAVRRALDGQYLAGLQGIPEELDEASAVDGASVRRRFRKITLPLLAPAITVSVTLSTIYGLGVFDQVFALTGGGPVDASETLATQIYKQTFAFGRFGYGTALSLILTVLITVLALAQLAVLRARENRL